MDGGADAAKEAHELDEAIREIRDRVRARYPEGIHDGIELPDLLPVLHARDAAQGKVAAIGTVNPRRPGALNGVIQFVKKMIARGLAWHVREQVEFNRTTVAGFDALIEALNANNRALVEIGGRVESARAALAGEIEETRGYVRQATDAIEAARADITALRADLAGTYAELGDLRSAWHQKSAGTDNELLRVENQLLRTIADLKASFEFRLGQASEEIQRRLWGDLARVREEYDRLIHTELRVLRQRTAAPAQAAAAASTQPAAAALDWAIFADRFRGSEEHVREQQRRYLPVFEKHEAVLDIGCGRGEFLELMREAGVRARGIETGSELVAACREKGLDVEAADVFAYLPALEDESLDGIFCAHVIEHLPPERLPELIRVAGTKVKEGGTIAIETPNPECLAIFATYFYVDPSHVRPVPPPLLRFYLEEAGFGRIETRRWSPAVETMPSLASLPPDFREAFFGGLDYALIARKL